MILDCEVASTALIVRHRLQLQTQSAIHSNVSTIDIAMQNIQRAMHCHHQSLRQGNASNPFWHSSHFERPGSLKQKFVLIL